MKKLLTVAITIGALTSALQVNAGWLDSLDKLKDAADVIKQTGVLDKVTPKGKNTDSSGNNTSNGDITPHVNQDEDIPFNFIPYPRSTLKNQVNNPYDRVNMPVSRPSKRPDGSVRPKYNVPMEGKVTLLQFRHKPDDSPLLIQKHYEAWLADQGFERLLICSNPCTVPNNGYPWRTALDPRKRLDSNYVPKIDTSYVVALKNDAMAVVGVGKFINDYSSIVKIVQGTIIDRSSWDKLKKPQTLPPATTASKGVSRVPSTTGVKAIAANDALAYVKKAKGVTFVQVSSYDRNCSFCVRINPEYDKFSIRHAGKAAFLQVAVQPWIDATRNDFAKAYQINAVPTTLAFKNGQLIRRLNGYADVNKMDKHLVK